MKKILFVGVGLSIIAISTLIAFAHNSASRWYIGSDLYEIDGVIYSAGSILGGVFTINGKSTLNGELEVNDSDVDVNMTETNNTVRIDQTNAAGQASTALIKITDARTGTTADEASEAALHITAAGVYGMVVADGIVQIEGEIDTASGDITLDPAGGNVIVDGDVDADNYTANAGEGIDVKTAGALKVGDTTATSVDYGSSSVTAHTFETDGTGDSEIVFPAHSIGVGEIPAMTTGQILVGDSSDSNANAVAASGVTFGTDGTAAVDASALTAGTVASAIDGSAITNMDGANIASGDIDSDRLTANGVVVSDFTQDSGVLVGTGAGAFAEETGDTLRTSLGLAIGSDVLAPDGDGSSLTGVALDTEVYGAAEVTVGDIASGQVITTNTIVMKDVADATKAGYALARVWMSETAYGATSTNNIEGVTLTGAEVEEVVANADYWQTTTSDGTLTATITGTSDGTNYINVAVGANVTSEAIVLLP